MKRPWIWITIVANLIGLIILAFVYPSAMVSPGALLTHPRTYVPNTRKEGMRAFENCVSCYRNANAGERGEGRDEH